MMVNSVVYPRFVICFSIWLERLRSKGKVQMAKTLLNRWVDLSVPAYEVWY